MQKKHTLEVALRLNFVYSNATQAYISQNKNFHLCMHSYIWIIYGLYELWSPMFMRQVSLFPFLASNKNERRLARKREREKENWINWKSGLESFEAAALKHSNTFTFMYALF